jgi:hypothetical protein
MSVYANQTNSTPFSSYFALAGSGGGGTPSNWSSYPALSPITYSGGGGVANFTEVYTAIGISTPQIYASTIVGADVYAINTMSAIEIQTDNLFVSSINSAAYPPVSSGPIVGTLPIPEGSNAITSEIVGVTGSSVITGIYTSSDASINISALTPGSNEITITLTNTAPPGSRFNYAIYPAAT